MINERLVELKQCPQCHTMKAFSTDICYRCLDRNEAKKEVKQEVEHIVKAGYDSMLDQKIMEARASERDLIVKKLMRGFDELESNDIDKSMEQWKNYKFIRNNIRDIITNQ